MPEVSVIIPAYRVARYIAEALDSVLAQTFSDYEIIVVNDGCPETDLLERVLGPYRNRIVYLKQSNGGPSAARNAGVRASRAPFVAFLDGDDAWEPRYLECQMSFLYQNPSIDVVYCDGVIIGDSSDAGRRLMDLSPSEGEVSFAKLVRQECTVFLSVTARKEAILRAGGFNPKFRAAEDFELWLKVLKTGGRFAYYRTPLIRYRRRSESLSADTLRMRQSALEILEEFERRTDLTPAEREAIEQGKRRFQAEICFFQGLQAFDSRNTAEAVEMLASANRYFRRRPLALKIWLLKHFPAAAYAAVGLRRRKD